jgi:hypothetical protein
MSNVTQRFNAATGTTERLDANGAVISRRVDRSGLPTPGRKITHTNGRGSFLVEIGEDKFCKLLVEQRILGAPYAWAYWRNGVEGWEECDHDSAPEEARELAANLIAPGRIFTRMDEMLESATMGLAEDPEVDRRHPGVWKGDVQVSGRPRPRPESP